LNLKINKVLALLLFLICLRIGFHQAYHKQVWNDEIYTHMTNVSAISYGDILLGRVKEGNTCPLFYLIQKTICDITQYTAPPQWSGPNRDWQFSNLESQILLRINPVIFMSLFIVSIFYYFSRYFSVWAGLYSIVISFSSFMLWSYWAEARPYALWVFLTTLQSLIFLYLIRESGNKKQGWRGLSIVHVLLSLTVVISIIQIIIVSVLLWLVLEKNWRKYIALCVVPVIIGCVYYALSPKYEFWFKDGPWALINASIPKDRFLIFFMFVLCLLLSCRWPQKYLPKAWKINVLEGPGKREAWAYLLLTGLMIAGCFLVLLKFKLGESLERQGFFISNRYFIFLTPIGIIATTLFSVYLVKFSKNKIIQVLMVIVLTGLTVMRAHRTSQFF